MTLLEAGSAEGTGPLAEVRPECSESAYSKNLDILRAFAVLCVFAGHLIQSFFFHGNAVVGRAARFGVIVFFVHTALVLMQSMERLKGDGRLPFTLTFYVRRAFRIYPLAIVTVLVVAFFAIPPMPWELPEVMSKGTVGSNLLLVQNLARRPSVLAPLWSLPYEVQMYLLLPLCFWLVNKGRVNAGWLWLAGAAIFLPSTVYARSLVRYFPCFLAGVWVYQTLQRRSRERLIGANWWPLFIVLACAGYTAASAAVRWRVDEGSQANLLVVIDWFFALAVGLAIPRFAEAGGSRLGVAHVVAKYSYGIYLSHVPVMWFVITRLQGQAAILRAVVLVAGCVVIPWAAYHLLEEPMIKLGKKLTGSRDRGELMAVAP